MHDINTRRDAFDTMAEVILEAREVSARHVEGAMKYSRTTKANVLRAIREDNPDFVASDDYDYIEFEYDGMTFLVCREDEYRERLNTQVEMLVEDTEYEVAKEMQDAYYWNQYVKFDAESFRRDLFLSGDADSLLACYDGTVHEVHTINGWFRAWRID